MCGVSGPDPVTVRASRVVPASDPVSTANGSSRPAGGRPDVASAMSSKPFVSRPAVAGRLCERPRPASQDAGRGRFEAGARSPLGEWRTAAPAGRYSAAAVVEARGTQRTDGYQNVAPGPAYSPRGIGLRVPRKGQDPAGIGR